MSGVSRISCSKLLNVRTTACGIIRSMRPRSPIQVNVLASIMAISGDSFMFTLIFPCKVTQISSYLKKK